MGPVSFARFSFADREQALDLAKRLAAAGIRVHTVDQGTTVLVGNDDLAVAQQIAADDGQNRTSGKEMTDTDNQPVVMIEPLLDPIDAVVTIPGSKSHTNRALLCAALARHESKLSGLLHADDTAAMISALGQLGRPVSVVDDDAAGTTVTVEGSDHGFDQPDNQRPVSLDVRQSGTTGRFLLPVLAASNGRFVLDGDEQLRARPFGPQLTALRQLGADIGGDSLPLAINGRRLAGGLISVAGNVSSQFLSGLLMASPLFATDTVINLDGDLVSRPYVELTLDTMAAFGVDVEVDWDQARFTVPVTPYEGATLAIEPDASAASYFFAAAAMVGGRVRVNGLGRHTVQGDLGFVYLLERMGAKVVVADDYTEVTGTGTLRGIEADMADLSDTAQTLAVVAAVASSPTTVTGVGFIRHKETDRIAATTTELRKLGIEAEATDDGFIIRPGPLQAGIVDTYDDHRMAMSFALLGLVSPGIGIANPRCVAKTFPHFFSVLESLRPSTPSSE